ncbi:uncharacterized protein LY79DRAFT_165216 [Colletotrichum navitas]|uniref:Uncharacterized protein n=1 Tax=Colletotrichum navitas TaxID=681940 RepID=A0AAD8Q1J0_9PEZI|nr:uncharacterized protein LY79DRAFT_165216 [Colletotrichum navitas]KAK1593963.1 hypothetical protein LY79DRAFT_165216 [Colletotrichum navitas]
MDHWYGDVCAGSRLHASECPCTRNICHQRSHFATSDRGLCILSHHHLAGMFCYVRLDVLRAKWLSISVLDRGCQSSERAYASNQRIRDSLRWRIYDIPYSARRKRKDKPSIRQRNRAPVSIYRHLSLATNTRRVTRSPSSLFRSPFQETLLLVSHTRTQRARSKPLSRFPTSDLENVGNVC